MGALALDKCFPDQTIARDAFFSGKGVSFSVGEISYQAWHELVSGVWKIKRQAISSTGVVANLSDSVATVPTFPECDYNAPFVDGMAIGWLLAGLLIMSWGFLLLKRMIR